MTERPRYWRSMRVVTLRDLLEVLDRVPAPPRQVPKHLRPFALDNHLMVQAYRSKYFSITADGLDYLRELRLMDDDPDPRD